MHLANRARNTHRKNYLTAAGLVSAVAFAGATHAHGFGQRYDLPVPLWLYLTGAGAAVGVSFLVMVLFYRGSSQPDTCPRINLLTWRIGRVLAHPLMLSICRALATALFVLVVCAGLFGVQTPFKNIAPVMVWAIWWVGMAYISALLGNLWALINPLDIAYAWTESAYARVKHGAELSLGLRYPEGLGLWPAVALYFAFAWSELVWERSDVPASVATAILIYSAITWVGMFLFGRETWLRRGETFSLVFGLLARFAPTEFRVANAKPEWNLRPYAVGLLSDEPVPPSLLALVVLILVTVTFDGILETPPWVSLVAWFDDWLSAPPLLQTVGAVRTIACTFGLVAFWILFMSVYFVFAWLIARMAATVSSGAGLPRDQIGTATVARFFVLTLVPIAIAYHLAHYLSFLLMAGQYVIPLASDPFGFGWDLFGTTGYFVRIAIIDARFVWYLSVIAIVIGHIAAVYLAHAMALRVFKEKRAAIRSQYPMLVLMIGYTMLSLWIIAQPIVSSRPG